MPTTTRVRRPIGTRRLGYAVGAAVNAILLYLVNGRPGWEALPFLTADTAWVLLIVRGGLVFAFAGSAIGIVAGLVSMARGIAVTACRAD